MGFTPLVVPLICMAAVVQVLCFDVQLLLLFNHACMGDFATLQASLNQPENLCACYREVCFLVCNFSIFSQLSGICKNIRENLYRVSMYM